MYTQSDRLRELAMVRSNWVEERMERFANAREGEFTAGEYEEHYADLHRQWRAFYPALTSLFPSHLPPTEVTR